MGTASTTKFIKNSSGNLAEEAALTTSVGVADAQKIPALNGNGVLDLSIVNGKASSAGAGDAGKLAALDSSGRLHPTMMPVGVSPEVGSITTSEALAAGDWVNIYNNAGAKARKADGTTSGKPVHGFVLAAYGSGVSADVHFEGANTAVTGMTPGEVYLSTTAGLGSAVPPSGAGNVVQRIGLATSATSVNFEPRAPITLA